MSHAPLRVVRRLLIAAVAVVSLPLAPVAPAAASDVLFAVTSSAELISVRSEIPGLPYVRKRISGLPDGALPLGLTNRPGSGELMLSVRDGGLLRFFTVDPATGAAQAFSAGATPIGATTTADVDFEPGGGLVRFVSVGGNHLLIDPVSGASTPQGKLRYAPGDPGQKTTPKPAGIASAPGGAIVAFDTARRSFGLLGGVAGSPSSGLLTTLGSVAFPVAPRGPLTVSPSDGRVYVALSDAGEQQSNLYAADGATYLPAYMGPFPDKDPVVGLTVGAGGLLDFDRSIYRVRESAGSVRVVVQRSGTITAPAHAAFEVDSDTATVGEDLPATVGVIAFGPGQEAASVDVPIHADSVSEGQESAKVRMTTTGGPAGFGYRRQARVEIVDGGASSRPVAATGTPVVPASPKPIVPPIVKPPKKPAAKRLSLVVSAPKLRSIGRRLTIPFRCSRPCRVHVEARLDRKTARRARRPAFLGQSRRTLKRAGKGNVRIKVSRWSKRTRAIRSGTVTFRVRAISTGDPSQVSLSVKTRVRRR